MTDKFRAGDVIKYRLDRDDAKFLNEGYRPYIFENQILSVEPAPEPFVGYVNVYEDGRSLYKSKEYADQQSCSDRLSCIKITYDPATNATSR